MPGGSVPELAGTRPWQSLPRCTDSPFDAMSGLAAQLAQARFESMDRLATTLIDHARRTAPMTDDIALLLIGLAATG
ncbi:hypothetical protein ACGFZQ_12425 [Streptomyces sp. NPDC048254]|uniref:hypothetical protein n=1 Tax=Streptomyces sp. NPDC048254 TaxID=3365525 RepID=UPI003724709F